MEWKEKFGDIDISIIELSQPRIVYFLIVHIFWISSKMLDLSTHIYLIPVKCMPEYFYLLHFYCVC